MSKMNFEQARKNGMLPDFLVKVYNISDAMDVRIMNEVAKQYFGEKEMTYDILAFIERSYRMKLLSRIFLVLGLILAWRAGSLFLPLFVGEQFSLMWAIVVFVAGSVSCALYSYFQCTRKNYYECIDEKIVEDAERLLRAVNLVPEVFGKVTHDSIEKAVAACGGQTPFRDAIFEARHRLARLVVESAGEPDSKNVLRQKQKEMIFQDFSNAESAFKKFDLSITFGNSDGVVIEQARKTVNGYKIMCLEFDSPSAV